MTTYKRLTTTWTSIPNAIRSLYNTIKTIQSSCKFKSKNQPNIYRLSKKTVTKYPSIIIYTDRATSYLKR